MKRVGVISLWLLGAIAMMIGLCFIVGIAESILLTLAMKPVGVGIMCLGYKFMVWSEEIERA
jgi:hypothetical protein